MANEKEIIYSSDKTKKIAAEILKKLRENTPQELLREYRINYIRNDGKLTGDDLPSLLQKFTDAVQERADEVIEVIIEQNIEEQIPIGTGEMLAAFLDGLNGSFCGADLEAIEKLQGMMVKNEKNTKADFLMSSLESLVVFSLSEKDKAIHELFKNKAVLGCLEALDEEELENDFRRVDEKGKPLYEQDEWLKIKKQAIKFREEKLEKAIEKAKEESKNEAIKKLSDEDIKNYRKNRNTRKTKTDLTDEELANLLVYKIKNYKIDELVQEYKKENTEEKKIKIIKEEIKTKDFSEDFSALLKKKDKPKQLENISRDFTEGQRDNRFPRKRNPNTKVEEKSSNNEQENFDALIQRISVKSETLLKLNQEDMDKIEISKLRVRKTALFLDENIEDIKEAMEIILESGSETLNTSSLIEEFEAWINLLSIMKELYVEVYQLSKIANLINTAKKDEDKTRISEKLSILTKNIVKINAKLNESKETISQYGKNEMKWIDKMISDTETIEKIISDNEKGQKFSDTLIFNKFQEGTVSVGPRIKEHMGKKVQEFAKNNAFTMTGKQKYIFQVVCEALMKRLKTAWYGMFYDNPELKKINEAGKKLTSR